MKIVRVKVLFMAAMVIAVVQIASAQAINATIDASQVHDPINKYLYGQFIEHLGNTINSNFWAEMLDDRKFYNVITSRLPATAAAPPRGRGFVRRWMPVGPDSAITMDTKLVFVGDHSPRVELDPKTTHGIRESGLAIRKGKSYTGHIVLAGDAGVSVSVSLIWGTIPADRQTVSLDKITGDYATYPLSFTAGADSDAAQFEISAIGSGSFHIGAVSLMPADNIQGFRPEVIAALSRLHSGMYRFPGGNYISNYEWRDAIGDRDHRPPTWDHAWNALQPNDVGLDEFMVLFKLLGVDPYITINAGFGDEYSAAQLVEYANGAVTTPMGKLRAANGHPDPYNIKLWGIGNEMYGDWQLGVMPPDQYQVKHNIFAKAMRKVDPTITLVASGAMPDEMTTTLQGKRLDGNILTQIGSRGDWTGGMLTHCLDNIDIISEHCYCTNNQGFDLATGNYEEVDEPLVDWVRRPANRVQAKYEAYEQYLQVIPGMKDRHITVSVDEYSYRNTRPGSYKPAMAYAMQFHELFRHTDVFQMAAFTFATSCLSSNRTDAELNPVGLMFKMYRDHFGELPVDVTGNSPQPAPKYPVGGDQPKVNAGSDTYPLDVSAALTDDHKMLAIAIVNPTETPQQLNLSIKNATISGKVTLWRMAPANENAANILGQPPQVQVEQQAVDSLGPTLTLAPISINIYNVPVQ